MKTHITELLDDALADLRREGVVPGETDLDIKVERSRGAEHGHFASNLAMALAKPARKPPRELAQMLIERMPPSVHIDRTEVAGPGFINFFVADKAFQHVVAAVIEAGDAYGHSGAGRGRRVTVEFVSANPTGPLHVGHGRGAAYGDTLANVLAATGHEVQREYYVNDAGRQTDILAVSVWLRYLGLCGEAVRFPDNGYRGEYVVDIARELRNTRGDELRVASHRVTAELPADGGDRGDKETHIDALVERAREILGDSDYRRIASYALDTILDGIRADLEAFRVRFDEWFSEKSLHESGAIPKAVAKLEADGYVYEKDGAKWFRSADFGDEKDRVLVRRNGQTTYFASDAAYFLNKRERGFDHAVYVLGADHHGYVARLKAAAQGLESDPDAMEAVLVQFAILYRGREKVPMSTRAGEFVTLSQLREEVGTDAARFFYIARSNDQHLDFDLELAKRRSNENPVYYVQYAHARIVSVFRQVAEKDLHAPESVNRHGLKELTEPQELALLEELMAFPDLLDSAARGRAPHLIAHYLREVASRFHVWYNGVPILVEDETRRAARLNLCRATRQVLVNGLTLIGVDAPERM